MLLLKSECKTPVLHNWLISTRKRIKRGKSIFILVKSICIQIQAEHPTTEIAIQVEYMQQVDADYS